MLPAESSRATSCSAGVVPALLASDAADSPAAVDGRQKATPACATSLDARVAAAAGRGGGARAVHEPAGVPLLGVDGRSMSGVAGGFDGGGAGMASARGEQRAQQAVIALQRCWRRRSALLSIIRCARGARIGRIYRLLSRQLMRHQRAGVRFLCRKGSRFLCVPPVSSALRPAHDVSWLERHESLPDPP
jgi:hypothetical protein